MKINLFTVLFVFRSVLLFKVIILGAILFPIYLRYYKPTYFDVRQVKFKLCVFRIFMTIFCRSLPFRISLYRCINVFFIIWASSWDYGTYHIGDQQRLRWASASAQSRQSLRCSHTWSMEIDEGYDQKSDISPTGWLHMRVQRMSLWRRKNTIISWAGSIIFVVGILLIL